jgi:hypothetical protein
MSRNGNMHESEILLQAQRAGKGHDRAEYGKSEAAQAMKALIESENAPPPFDETNKKISEIIAGGRCLSNVDYMPICELIADDLREKWSPSGQVRRSKRLQCDYIAKHADNLRRLFETGQLEKLGFPAPEREPNPGEPDFPAPESERNPGEMELLDPDAAQKKFMEWLNQSALPEDEHFWDNVHMM